MTVEKEVFQTWREKSGQVVGAVPISETVSDKHLQQALATPATRPTAPALSRSLDSMYKQVSVFVLFRL